MIGGRPATSASSSTRRKSPHTSPCPCRLASGAHASHIASSLSSLPTNHHAAISTQPSPSLTSRSWHPSRLSSFGRQKVRNNICTLMISASSLYSLWGMIGSEHVQSTPGADPCMCHVFEADVCRKAAYVHATSRGCRLQRSEQPFFRKIKLAQFSRLDREKRVRLTFCIQECSSVLPLAILIGPETTASICTSEVHNLSCSKEPQISDMVLAGQRSIGNVFGMATGFARSWIQVPGQ